MPSGELDSGHSGLFCRIAEDCQFPDALDSIGAMTDSPAPAKPVSRLAKIGAWLIIGVLCAAVVLAIEAVFFALAVH